MNEQEREMSTESQVRSERKKKTRNKRIKQIVTWVVIIALLVAGLQTYSFYKKNGYFPWADAKAPVSQIKETEVKVYESSFTTTIDLSGFVEPFDSQNVILRSTGTVTDVFVSEGDSVKKGDVLIAIDNTNQLYDVASLESEIEKESSAVAYATLNFYNSGSRVLPTSSTTPKPMRTSMVL